MQESRPTTVLTDYDITLFQGGNHYRLYQKLGAQPAVVDGEKGYTFAVYAPAAKKVSVIGDFNRWQAGVHELYARWDHSGVWEGFIPGVQHGMLYKFAIESHNGWQGIKADPYARFSEHPPQTASVIYESSYAWHDDAWMQKRGQYNRLGAPLSIYEVHLASWKRHGD